MSGLDSLGSLRRVFKESEELLRLSVKVPEKQCCILTPFTGSKTVAQKVERLDQDYGRFLSPVALPWSTLGPCTGLLSPA